jgi:hypothetical protein
LVVGTVACELHVHSLADGGIVRSVSLQGELPVDILTTAGWCFIIVRTRKSVFVFNVNGLPVSRLDAGEPVLLWGGLTSQDGFDFCVVQNQAFELAVIDVVCPEERETVAHGRDAVAVDYDSEAECFVMVFATGRVRVVPWRPCPPDNPSVFGS